MRQNDRNNSRGFTLLELLVALAIFSLIAVMAYGGLETVLNQQSRTEENADSLATLEKTYLIMQRDIEQMVPRTIRDEYGDSQAPLVGTSLFQFTRGGWNNPANQPRSTLQRVGYALQDQQLIRYAWMVLDRAQDSAPVQQPLADDIKSMQVRYLDQTGNWQDQWPPLQMGNTPGAGPIRTGNTPGATPIQAGNSLGMNSVDFPLAIEITLEHMQFGSLVWLFQLPR
jgi:general secretion pathway protein J